MSIVIWSHYLDAVIEQLNEQNLLNDKAECQPGRPGELIIRLPSDDLYNEYIGFGAAAIGCGFVFGFVVSSEE